MALAPKPARVEIEAPSAGAAFALESRLAHLAPTAVGRGDRWVVELPTVGAREDLEAVVREWLARIGTEATTLRVDGRMIHVHASHSARAHVATNRSFIG